MSLKKRGLSLFFDEVARVPLLPLGVKIFFAVSLGVRDLETGTRVNCAGRGANPTAIASLYELGEAGDGTGVLGWLVGGNGESSSGVP